MEKKKRKKRVIRRRKKGSTTKLYFDENTQAAICDFQTSTCSEERGIIYRDRIASAFEKLAENLILIYGFAKKGENFSALKNDCVSFCYETLYKFDNSRGTKAFSYFNVVAKNWLILNSRRRKRITSSHVSIHDTASFTALDKVTIANSQISPSPDDVMIEKEFKEEIMKILVQIQDRVEGKNEIACINAIVKIFEMVDQLDFLNKRAIFVYVREYSGLNSKQLSASMSSIRKLYRELKSEDPFFL